MKDLILNLFKKKEVEQMPKIKAVSVLMKDGTLKEYPEHFMITDGKNCVVCNSKLYHTSLDCSFLRTEMNENTQIRAMKIYDAQAQYFEYCYECQKNLNI